MHSKMYIKLLIVIITLKYYMRLLVKYYVNHAIIILCEHFVFINK